VDEVLVETKEPLRLW